MGDAGYFRGTSAEQDNRFSDKEKKLLKQMKFADSIATKVDMSKVKLEVLKPWISNRIIDLLGMDDDVLVEFVSNQLEAENFPDGRRIQINLTGFLNGKNARIFTGELWDLLISAQEQDSGIPASILEAKKEEIKQRQEEKQKVKETVERTLGHFLPSIKKEKSSPPPGLGKDSSDNHHSNPSKKDSRTRDSDRRPDQRENDRGRQYRKRPSRSHSPPSFQAQTRNRSRDRFDRNRRDMRGERNDRRESPTPQQLIDAARERDRRERGRNRIDTRYNRGGGGDDRDRGHRSPLPFRVPFSPEQTRGRGRPDPFPGSEDHRRIIPERRRLLEDLESSSGSSSSSDSAEESPGPKKKKAKRASSEPSSSPRSKKKKKKSKKQKKQKKGKKKEVKGVEESSSPSDDDDDEDDNARNREDLERSLRERALASMKKRQERDGNSKK